MILTQADPTLFGDYTKCPYGITYNTQHIKGSIEPLEKSLVPVASYTCIMLCEFAVKQESRICKHVKCTCPFDTNLIGINRGCI